MDHYYFLNYLFNIDLEYLYLLTFGKPKNVIKMSKKQNSEVIPAACLQCRLKHGIVELHHLWREGDHCKCVRLTRNVEC